MPQGNSSAFNTPPHSAYNFERCEDIDEQNSPDVHNNNIANEFESMELSSHVDSESYLAIHTLAESSLTAGGHYHTEAHADATDTVHEMHLALLYLLSNPEEFQKALSAHPARGSTTLIQWNAEYDNESLTEAESVQQQQTRLSSGLSPPTNANSGSINNTTPLPFVVFADDAEVVLPQAHTASQLFGIERLEGIELEAAAGIPAISQLFLRWLGKKEDNHSRVCAARSLV